MAGRILNRRELRKQADQADQIETAALEAPESTADAPVEKKKKAKAPTVRAKKPPKAKKAPPRVRARWGVFDGAMKQVAVFDYNQRAAADEKLVALRTKNKGSYFLQIVKELMPEPAVDDTADLTAIVVHP